MNLDCQRAKAGLADRAGGARRNVRRGRVRLDRTRAIGLRAAVVTAPHLAQTRPSPILLQSASIIAGGVSPV